MKIKGSVKGLKINSAFVVFAIGTVAALGVRIYQTLSGLINFETGFYNKDDITTYILYGILAISAVVIFMIAYLSWEIPQEKMPENKNILLAFVSLAMSATLAFEAVGKFEAYFAVANAYVLDPDNPNKISYLMKSGALPQLAEAVFAVLSVMYFITLVIKYTGLKNVNLTKIKALSLCPLFWVTFRMIERFTRTISFMNVSGLILELFMIAFMMMFFMYLAQTSSQVNSVAISFKLFAYGLIGSMFSLVVSVPRLVLTFVNDEYKMLAEQNMLECPLETADIAFGVFAIVFLVACLSMPRIRNMTAKQTEKIINE